MILTRKKILEEINKKTILIEPFNEEYLGPNSYNLHLGRYLLIYTDRVLDARVENNIEEVIIPSDGIVLQPNTIYLGVSEEYTEIYGHVPFLEGITSAARLGINVNPSSGKGSIGHTNTWTIELSVIQPIRVYRGMPISQLIFFTVDGEIDLDYNKMKSSKYRSRTVKPVESMMWKNKF